MAALPLLSPDNAQSLKSAVREAASKALKYSSESPILPNAVTQRRLNAELNACVAEVISELSSAFNAEATVLARFSNELWCIVFSYLPIKPLVTVTHVCRTWRTVALACTMLWCCIQYRSDLCERDCPIGPGSSNLDLVRAFLARSGGILPISLDINIHLVPGFSTSSGGLKHLADTLQPYAHRLTTMHFFCEDTFAHLWFFENFDCLPSLHTLSVRCYESPYSWLSRRGAFFLNEPLSLPALKNLQLVVGEETGMFAPFDLLSLVSLDIGLGAAGDILAYLDVAPNIRQMQLHAAPSIERESPGTYQRVRERAPAGDIKIMSIHADVEDAILAMFDSDSHTNLHLDYRFPDDLFPQVPGMRILRHLDCIAELSVIPRLVDATQPDGPQQVVVSARDSSGKVRTLSFVWQPHMVRLSDIWGYLNNPPLSLVVEARQWSESHPPKRMSEGIKRLTIIISPLFTLSALVQSTLTVSGPFSALEELTISAQSSEMRISPATLRSFLRLLRIPGPVHVLHLHRVAIDGDVTLLKAISRAVQFL